MSESFHMEPGLPPISVVRRKRQKTMRIRVGNDQVVVSGPASISRGRLLDFVREKSEWIQKSCEKRRQRTEKLEKLRQEHKGTLLLRGERKPVHPFPVPGIRKARLVEHDHAVVYQYRPEAFQAGLQDGDQMELSTDLPSHSTEAPVPDQHIVRKFYLETAKRELSDRLAYWSERLPFQPGKLVVRNQKTKWGSCSRRGTISLNWRLIKCPPAIMDYIIIHELCHLRHFNHSRAFWDTVARYYPDVANARSWVRLHTDEIFADF